MLSVINPINMAMNMPCCTNAPYCIHSQRQLPSQVPSFLTMGLGSSQDGPSWSHRSPAPQHVQYDFNRLPQPSTLLRQNQNYLDEGSKYSQSLTSFPPPPPRHGASWSASNHTILNNDFSSASWLPDRSRNTYQAAISSSFPHGPYDYLSDMKLDPFDLKEGSPSRTTEFSTVSVSTESSPAPTAALAGYDSTHMNDDGDSYLPSQPLAPEQLTVGSERHTLSLSPAFGSQSPSKRGRSRRKGSEAIHCEICHKSFDRRSNFKSHWETHDKDRQRTVCKMDGCNKTFGRPAEMTRHVNSAHRQKLFPCPSCGKEFTRHDILLRHCKDACPVLVKGRAVTKKRRDKHSP